MTTSIFSKNVKKHKTNKPKNVSERKYLSVTRVNDNFYFFKECNLFFTTK